MSHDKITFDSDRRIAINGVPGRLTHRTVKPGRPDHLWFKQRWISDVRPFPSYGHGAQIRVTVRFDDELGNGHNTFSITGEITTPASRRRRDIAAGGCIHDEITAAFPELAHLIKWHLCSTGGPLHYVANTLYHARENGPTHAHIYYTGKDPLGLSAKGETLLVYTGAKDANRAEAHPDYRVQWDAKTAKTADLAAARNAAVWPDATDEQLRADPAELEKVLLARLPDLLAAFRADMTAAGLLWSPQEFETHAPA